MGRLGANKQNFGRNRSRDVKQEEEKVNGRVWKEMIGNSNAKKCSEWTKSEKKTLVKQNKTHRN